MFFGMPTVTGKLFSTITVNKVLFPIFGFLNKKLVIMGKYIYELEMKVRDYECDIQGIVNNSVYQNYLEHTRHEFLLTLGEDFERWTREGILAMVAKAELEYKVSLKSGDRFISRLSMGRKGPRYIFYQDIYRASDEKLCVKAQIQVITVVNGRLTRGDEFAQLFAPYLHENA